MEENKNNESPNASAGIASPTNASPLGLTGTTDNQENKLTKENSAFNQGNTPPANTSSTPGGDTNRESTDKKENIVNKLFGKKTTAAKETSGPTAQVGAGANKGSKTGTGATAPKTKEVKAEVGTKDQKEAAAPNKTVNNNLPGKGAADQNTSDEFQFGRPNGNIGSNNQPTGDKNTPNDQHKQIPGEFGSQSYNDHDNFSTAQRGSWGNQGGSYGHEQGDTFSRNQGYQGNFDNNQGRGQRGNYGYEAYDNEGSGYQSASRGGFGTYGQQGRPDQSNFDHRNSGQNDNNDYRSYNRNYQGHNDYLNHRDDFRHQSREDQNNHPQDRNWGQQDRYGNQNRQQDWNQNGQYNQNRYEDYGSNRGGYGRTDRDQRHHESYRGGGMGGWQDGPGDQNGYRSQQDRQGGYNQNGGFGSRGGSYNDEYQSNNTNRGAQGGRDNQGGSNYGSHYYDDHTFRPAREGNGSTHYQGSYDNPDSERQNYSARWQGGFRDHANAPQGRNWQEGYDSNYRSGRNQNDNDDWNHDQRYRNRNHDTNYDD